MRRHGEPYRLRFAFDPGSGVCLWAINEAARKRFGDAVELDVLPLREETRQEGVDLIRRFDTSLDWADPGGPSRWDERQRRAFDADADAWLAVACAELGRDVELRDERPREDVP